jgi:hypothetical protein
MLVSGDTTGSGRPVINKEPEAEVGTNLIYNTLVDGNVAVVEVYTGFPPKETRMFFNGNPVSVAILTSTTLSRLNPDKEIFTEPPRVDTEALYNVTVE